MNKMQQPKHGAPNRALMFICAAVILLGAMCIASVSAWALPERFYGMMAHESMNDSEPDWEALQKAGAQRFRMQIKWQKINENEAAVKEAEADGNKKEPWEYPAGWQNTYDRYFAKAAIHGIEILPYLYTRKKGSTQYYWTGEPAFKEWKEFVWTVVQRYGANGSFWAENVGQIPQYPVKYWEVWNEPNLKKNCSAELCNGKAYGEFLVATSKTIRNAQKGAKVLVGGLYIERWNYPVANYITALALAPGIKAAYDGLSIHPYALGKVSENRNYPEKVAGVPTDVFEAYNAQLNAETQTEGKLGNKGIWVTEVGWPVNGESATEESEAVDTVTESEQAGLLKETFNWLKLTGVGSYNVKYAAWYFYRDITTDTTAKWDQWAGLRSQAGDFRPSWYAYLEQTGATKWPARYMLGTSNGSSLSWSSTNLTEMTLPFKIAVGDVNGDGKDDIVAAEPSGAYYDYKLGISTGSGFSWSDTSLNGFYTPWFLALGDVTGDGKADIVAVEASENNPSTHLYNYKVGVSTGTNFTWTNTNLNGYYTPFQVGVGDVNGDGRDDIVAAEYPGNNLSSSYVDYKIGISNGGSNFTWLNTSLNGYYKPWQMGIGDVTGDGKADLVPVEASENNPSTNVYNYRLFTSSGTNFSWGSTNLNGYYRPWHMGLGDVNNDGYADIVSVEASGNNPSTGIYNYMFGLRSGSSFNWLGALSGLGEQEQMGVGDITGDGKADVVAVEAY